MTADDIARRQWLMLRHAARQLRDLMPYRQPPALPAGQNEPGRPRPAR
jgi:hypothetical protein